MQTHVFCLLLVVNESIWNKILLIQFLKTYLLFTLHDIFCIPFMIYFEDFFFGLTRGFLIYFFNNSALHFLRFLMTFFAKFWECLEVYIPHTQWKFNPSDPKWQIPVWQSGKLPIDWKMYNPLNRNRHIKIFFRNYISIRVDIFRL